MDNTNFDFLSNLYINYYYGSYTHCSANWKEYHAANSFSKFYYIMDGECEIVMNDTIYHGCKGRLFLIPAHTSHSYYHISEDFVVKYWIHFVVNTNDEKFLLNLNLPPYVDVGIDNELIKCFQDIFVQSTANTLVASLGVKANLLTLLFKYISYSGKNELIMNTKNTQNLYPVISYINNHLQNKLTINELSSIMHMHPNYFIRLFKKEMGVPPLKYINNLRVEHAKALLENTSLPISEVMVQVGFNDLSTFSNFFKHYTSYNPRAFRIRFEKDAI